MAQNYVVLLDFRVIKTVTSNETCVAARVTKLSTDYEFGHT